jgi:hypothetical protein
VRPASVVVLGCMGNSMRSSWLACTYMVALVQAQVRSVLFSMPDDTATTLSLPTTELYMVSCKNWYGCSPRHFYGS